MYSIGYPKDIKSKICEITGCNGNITKYEVLNSSVNIELGSEDIYRSVILDPETKELLCFSPPKTINIDIFKNKYPELREPEKTNETTFYANEIIEGTMVNLFFDKRINSWEIATKGSVGGNYWFFRNQYNEVPETFLIPEYTFKQMFLQVINDESSDNNQIINNDINSNEWINTLDKGYSYCFILKHPNNHIVNIVDKPALYIVAIYSIQDSSVNLVDPVAYESWGIFNNNSPVKFPKKYIVESYAELEEIIEINNSDPYYREISMGIMILNTNTGERTLIENPKYKYIRELRGYHPNIKYHWLILNKELKIDEFLSVFPKYINHFIAFRNQFNNLIKEIHNGYVSYYVKKSGKRIEKNFKLIYKIHHELYLPAKETGNPIIIRREVVADFISKLDPKEVFHSL